MMAEKMVELMVEKMVGGLVVLLVGNLESKKAELMAAMRDGELADCLGRVKVDQKAE